MADIETIDEMWQALKKIGRPDEITSTGTLKHELEYTAAFGQPMVFLDAETTGRTNEDRIIEVGMLKVLPHEIEVFHSLVNPDRRRLNRNASNYTGLTLEDLKDAPKFFPGVISKIYTEASGCVIIGHSLKQVTLRMIKNEAARAGLQPLENLVPDTLDIMYVARKYPWKESINSTGLKQLLESFCMDFHGTGLGCALADCFASLFILQEMVKQHPKIIGMQDNARARERADEEARREKAREKYEEQSRRAREEQQRRYQENYGGSGGRGRSSGWGSSGGDPFDPFAGFHGGRRGGPNANNDDFSGATRDKYRLASDCPLCGKPLRLRRNRSDGNKFWGCTGYPACRFTEDYEARSTELITEIATLKRELWKARNEAEFARRNQSPRSPGTAGSPTHIKRLLKKLVFQFHPDRNPELLDHNRVVSEINVILDEVK